MRRSFTMNQAPFRILLILLLIHISQWMNAQAPVANFSGAPVSGCSPLSVSFTDQSTGSPTNWNWDFGNGQLSTVQNPVIIFTQPGRYNVKLVVRNANGVNGITRNELVIVNAAPVVDFTVNANAGCALSAFRFTDRSTVSDGVVNSWSWDFGDGSPTATGQQPSHVYTTPGVYNVTLVAGSSNGCTSTSTKTAFVQVTPGIVPAFSNTLPASCSAPFTVDFDNQTTGPGTLTYLWNFGNGTSTDADPAPRNYNAGGNYTVKLVAISSLGCRDSVQRTVAINGIVTSFTAPANACLNTPVTFQNGSTPASASWDFGNGAVSSSINPNYTYTTPGTYTVKLVNNYGSCIDSITRPVTVRNNPVVNFNAGNTVSCQAPFTTTFNDLTPNIASRVWDFGDGTPPVTTANASIGHTYTTTGSFTVRLTVTDNNGCQASSSRPAFIRIQAPAVSISNAPAGGCVNFPFTPVANINAIDGVNTYAWNFGDGFPSNQPNPSHTYTTQGTFTLSLSIVTNGGCAASVTVPNGIRTGVPPTGIDFTAAPASSCISSPIAFSSAATNADQRVWNFGDGTPGASGANVTHSYERPGIYSVTFTAYSNGCPATPVSKTVEVFPPFADFRAQVICGTDRVSFTNLSITDPAAGAVSYKWDFGDPAIPVETTAGPFTITYPSLGTYTASLIVFNGSCSDTLTRQIVLTQESAAFTASKTMVCKDESFTLSADNSNPNIRTYEWIIGSAAPVAGLATQPFSLNANGVYDIGLIVTDLNGCKDTVSMPGMIAVSGPTANFTAGNSVICGAAPVTFTDLSDAPQAIASWEWTFGDLSPMEPFSAPPFTHAYDTAGSYQVSLTVRDINGCAHTATIANAATIRRPVAFFRKDTTLYCPGIPVNFTDSSVGSGLTYLWQFGDGNTAVTPIASTVYNGRDSVYTAKLTVTDNLGCMDSLSRDIGIRSPKPAFDISDTATICLPYVADFVFRGADYQSFYWDPGDGSGISNVQDLQHSYGAYGAFAPKLYLVGYGGCLDSLSTMLVITDPNSLPPVYNAPTTCNELTVDFHFEPPSYVNFNFQFGDGDSLVTGGPDFSHLYDSPGAYVPTVKLIDGAGCEVTLNTQPTINIIGAEPLFGIDKTDFCDSSAVVFTNYTLGNDTVTSYLWEFGDNGVSADENTSHFYNAHGFYTPTLTVRTQSGCTDTFTDTVLVYASPVAENILDRDTVCINKPIPFSGELVFQDTSLVQYAWTFSDGESSVLKNPVKFFRTTGSFSVRLDTRNAYGCTSSISRPLHVAPPPTVNPMANQVIAVGSGITLPATYTGNVVAFNWQPDRNLDCNNCPNPVASPTTNTTYKVVATDTYGCTASGEITISVICNNNNFFIPNTFSPNQDGANDYFYPRGSGILRIQSLRIFNRWGETVFEKRNFAPNDATAGWNGTFKGKPAIADVYIYTIEVICENAQVIPFRGNIMLLR